MKYIKGLDTVRALAVIFVILSHWGPFFTPGSIANKIMTQVLPSGQFGVTLFFVLSGFLITNILLFERNKSELEGGSKSTIIKAFFVRRSLRIFPIYYITIITLFLLGHPYVREHLGYFLTYTGNMLPFMENKVNPLIHTWSLSVEEQFYLIWPWVILFIPRRFLPHVFIGAMVIGLLSRYIVMFPLHHSFPVLVINCMDAFGLGGLYAWVRQNRDKFAAFDTTYMYVLAALLFIGWRIARIDGTPFGIMYTRMLDIPISLGIIMFVLNNKSEFIRKYILENRVLNYLGKISYGLYLYHYVLEPIVQSYWQLYLASHPQLPAMFHSFGFAYFLNYASLLLLCWLSYNFVETPLLKLKKKFNYT